jgi:hypothetical protein
MPEIWEGWAYCAAESGERQMPRYVAEAVHPDCDQPTYAWCMLVGLQRERMALRSGERLPREVVGQALASIEDAEKYIERQMYYWTCELAYGSVESW